MKPQFSIIIPAHNGEKCISKCLDSVMSQTYRDFEVIVVCDACTDNTVEIVDKYSKRYSNFHYYQVNFERDGLTRNVGLDHAQGDWILFLDCDDWWLHEYVLEELKERIKLHPYVCCLYFSFIWKGNGYKRQNDKNHYLAVWNKLWRKSFIGDTRFTDRANWSDADFDRMMEQKYGERVYADLLIYYYNYMYEGSINDKYAKGLLC